MVAFHTIQELNRETVYAHWVDEIRHGHVFLQIAKLLYHKLNRQQKDLFLKSLINANYWLANSELENWSVVFNKIKLNHANLIISDCKIVLKEKLDKLNLDNFFNICNILGVDKNDTELFIS